METHTNQKRGDRDKFYDSDTSFAVSTPYCRETAGDIKKLKITRGNDLRVHALHVP